MTKILLTGSEVAQRLRISLRSLERLRADGSGPPWIRVSAGTKRGRIAYPESGLLVWLEQRSRRTA